MVNFIDTPTFFVHPSRKQVPDPSLSSTSAQHNGDILCSSSACSLKIKEHLMSLNIIIKNKKNPKTSLLWVTLSGRMKIRFTVLGPFKKQDKRSVTQTLELVSQIS